MLSHYLITLQNISRPIDIIWLQINTCELCTTLAYFQPRGLKEMSLTLTGCLSDTLFPDWELDVVYRLEKLKKKCAVYIIHSIQIFYCLYFLTVTIKRY